jgi:hypothetical protein
MMVLHRGGLLAFGANSGVELLIHTSKHQKRNDGAARKKEGENSFPKK